VLAAALADVLIRDLHPSVIVGVGDHPLDEAPALLLDVDAAGELGTGVGHPLGQTVAHALELPDPKDPRPAGRGDAPFEVAAREGGRKDLCQLAFEAGNLPPELGAGGPQVGGGRWPNRWRSEASPPLDSRSLRGSFEKLRQRSGPFAGLLA
jgi:hypothetical protein